MIQHEEYFQRQIVDFHNRAVSEQHAILFAVPNGGKRSPAQGARLKKMGVLAGVSDLILITQGATDFIEVKLRKSWLVKSDTTQSDSQKRFEERLTALGGRYWVVRSLEEYVEILDRRGVPLRFRPVAPPAQWS
jgi:hypothetical protein